MIVHRQLTALSGLPGPLHLAIGVFDGVHLGHQQVIRHAQNCADAAGGTAVVATFDPHPARVLRPEAAPRLLCSTRHKELILERLGVGHLLELEFDAALAALPAEDFVNLLRRSARPLGSISVGREWAFGRGREGNVGTLKLLGQRDGFAVHGAEPVCVDSEPVSSTRIRHAVEAGDFRLCERLLGREYSVLGRVTEGRRLGRKLGIPTANLTELAEQLPPVGVYAVHVSWNGSLHGGVANLGYRPTVEDTASVRTLEAHVFDFDGDLYGREMEVRFVQRLRDEMKLPDLAALQAQIQRDCAAARNILELQLAAADVEDTE